MGKEKILDLYRKEARDERRINAITKSTKISYLVLLTMLPVLIFLSKRSSGLIDYKAIVAVGWSSIGVFYILSYIHGLSKLALLIGIVCLVLGIAWFILYFLTI